MVRPSTASLFPLSCLLASAALAQVPDGWFVWGSFQGTAGQNGIYFSHPRDPGVPLVAVANLPPALAYDPAGRRGAASIAYRKSDGAVIAGERAPAGTSVDLHVLKLRGHAVEVAMLFSVGTSANVGEIPQCAVLRDGRIVVAATDLTAGGPLSQFQTLQYNWEGVGIVDTVGGGVTPVPIANLHQFPGVINGIAVSPDEQTLYIGNYISTSAGDLWAVPLAGGTATMVAALPFGASHLAVDNDGTVLVVTLNGPPNLFRYDPATSLVTVIPTAMGPLNAIAVERVTGNYAIASANAGTPARSLFWVEPNGQEHLLASPNLATISCVDVNPNPEAFATGIAAVASYDWQLAPNPGGLPTVGNGSFGLRVEADQVVPALALFVLGTQRLAPAATVHGVELHVDPAAAVTTLNTMTTGTLDLPLPIPNDPVFAGFALTGQVLAFELQSWQLAATPGVLLTVL